MEKAVAVLSLYMITGFFLFSPNGKEPFSDGDFLLKVGMIFGTT